MREGVLEEAPFAPVLVGSADLSAHPYRLRCPDGAQEFADVLATKLADPADASMVPFAATAEPVGNTVAATSSLERTPLGPSDRLNAGMPSRGMAAVPKPLPPAISVTFSSVVNC